MSMIFLLMTRRPPSTKRTDTLLPTRRASDLLRFEPLEAGSGVQFENEVVGGNVPKEYVPAVEKGIRQIAASGVLAGFPVIDFKATLYDGAYHDVDSSALAFEIEIGRAHV